MTGAAPLTFVWPTSVALEPGDLLLVVENGLHRLVRVDPRTQRITELATNLAKPYSVARARSGSVFVSDAGALLRLDGARPPRTVASASEDIGPIAIAPGGDVFFTTSSRVFRLEGGSGRPVPVAAGLSGPHGIGIAADGAVLVSDTGRNRVRRIDPMSGAVSTMMTVGSPRGIDVTSDGTIYVVESTTRRLVRFSRAGRRLGDIGPPFDDPYDVSVGTSAAYVVDTGASGVIRRVDRHGRATII